MRKMSPWISRTPMENGIFVPQERARTLFVPNQPRGREAREVGTVGEAVIRIGRDFPRDEPRRMGHSCIETERLRGCRTAGL